MKIIFILGPWFLSIFCHWKKSVLYFFVVFKSLFNLFSETQIPLSWWAFKFNLSKLGRFILWQAFLPPSQIYAYPLRHHLRIFSSSLSLKHPDLKLNTKPVRSTNCTKSLKMPQKFQLYVFCSLLRHLHWKEFSEVAPNVAVFVIENFRWENGK